MGTSLGGCIDRCLVCMSGKATTQSALQVAGSLTLALAKTASRGCAGRLKVPAAVHRAEPGWLRPALPVCRRLPGLHSAARQCRLLRLPAGVLLALRPHVSSSECGYISRSLRGHHVQ